MLRAAFLRQFHSQAHCLVDRGVSVESSTCTGKFLNHLRLQSFFNVHARFVLARAESLCFAKLNNPTSDALRVRTEEDDDQKPKNKTDDDYDDDKETSAVLLPSATTSA